MAKLVKIESTAQMVFTPPSGYVTSTFGEVEGQITELIKKSDGTITQIGGGSGSADAYVVVDDNGVLKAQKLSFNGTEASFDGTAETLDTTKVGLFATTQDEPAYKGSGGGGAFYKCASVDTDAKTWTGYLAVLGEEGSYSFEEAVTEGLTYTSVTPVIDKIFSADALVKVTSVYQGQIPFDSYTRVLLHFDGDLTDVTGNTTWAITSASYVEGVFNQAANGSPIQINTGLDTFNTDGQSCCFDFWMKYSGTSTGDAFAVYDGDGNGGVAIIGFNSSKRAIFRIGDHTQYTSDFAADSNFHHYAFCYDNTTNIARWYVDGKIYYEKTYTYNLNVDSLHHGKIWFESRVEVDEFRFSVGTPRWTEEFTPHDVAYADS